jgi:hypothetical protein
LEKRGKRTGFKRIVEGQKDVMLKGPGDARADADVEPREETQKDVLFCVNHPRVETNLRCNRCGDPICARCAVLTPVGYRCPKCVKQQQATFYTGLSVDYLIAALVSLPAAAAGAYIISLLGWWLLAIFISPVAGALVSDLAWRAVGRRRSRYLWLVVCGAIVVATIGVGLYQGGFFAGRPLAGVLTRSIGLIIYVVMAVSAAYGRLRLG